jgi:hypothetical protein
MLDPKGYRPYPPEGNSRCFYTVANWTGDRTPAGRLARPVKESRILLDPGRLVRPVKQFGS